MECAPAADEHFPRASLVESIRQLLDLNDSNSRSSARPDVASPGAWGPHAAGEPWAPQSAGVPAPPRGAAWGTMAARGNPELPVVLGSSANMPERYSTQHKGSYLTGVDKMCQGREVHAGLAKQRALENPKPAPQRPPKQPGPAPRREGRGCDESRTGPDAARKGGPASAEGVEDKWAGVSTVKLLNLPRRCTKQEILAVVGELGFGGSYDFFCLPMGLRSKQNHGYAFMNFTDPTTASRFRQAATGCRIRAKVINVTAASLQGLEQNWEHFNKVRALGWEPPDHLAEV